MLALIRTSGKSSALFLITRKKVLDKSVSMGYNESIKNGIGTKSNLIRVDRKKKMNSKSS